MLENQIQTPALVLDLDAFEENLQVMLAHCRRAKIALRPHYKSAKSTDIAHRQIAAGAKGICCSKVSEAVDLAEAGIEDVLIANQVTERTKINQVAALAKCCRLTICVDSAENIHALETAAAFLDATIYCLVEYDIGMDRCGVYTEEAFYALVQELSTCPHLVFEGVQAYAGHLAHWEDLAKRQAASTAVEERLGKLLSYLGARSVSVKEVSGISTGTIALRPANSVYTECQAGSFIYMDAAYRAVGVDFFHALSVLSTVMSQTGGHSTTDAGLKSVSTDQTPPFFREFPGMEVHFSEEHATIPTLDCSLNQRLHLIPSHCCTTLNLYDWLYLVRAGRVVDRVPVTGRGKSL